MNFPTLESVYKDIDKHATDIINGDYLFSFQQQRPRTSYRLDQWEHASGLSHNQWLPWLSCPFNIVKHPYGNTLPLVLLIVYFI